MTIAARPNFSLRRRTLLAAAVAAIGLGGASGAFAGPNLVDMTVVNRDTGRPMHVWRRHGRLFVAGQPGSRYALRVTNHTDGRVLVVMSVDGVNILTGETAGYDQRGYVFSPYETFDLTGWRKSNTQVAAFVFAPLPKSYAARTGRPAEVGVIGIAAFREKQVPVEAPPATARDRAGDGVYDRPAPVRGLPEPPPPPPPPPPDTSIGGVTGAAKAADLAAPSPGSEVNEVTVTGSRMHRNAYSSAAPTERLGTADGAREWSVIDTVEFERASAYPETIAQIEYDTYDNLVARGVIPRSDPTHRPRPFPGKPDDQGYVPDPPPEL